MNRICLLLLLTAVFVSGVFKSKNAETVFVAIDNLNPTNIWGFFRAR